MGTPRRAERVERADDIAMSDAYNGICGAIASLKKMTEEARPWAILTHLEVVRESLAVLLTRRTYAQEKGRTDHVVVAGVGKQPPNPPPIAGTVKDPPLPPGRTDG